MFISLAAVAITATLSADDLNAEVTNDSVLSAECEARVMETVTQYQEDGFVPFYIGKLDMGTTNGLNDIMMFFARDDGMFQTIIIYYGYPDRCMTEFNGYDGVIPGQ